MLFDNEPLPRLKEPHCETFIEVYFLPPEPRFAESDDGCDFARWLSFVFGVCCAEGQQRFYYSSWVKALSVWCGQERLYLFQPQVGAVWLRTPPHVQSSHFTPTYRENSAEIRLINHVFPQTSKITKCIYRVQSCYRRRMLFLVFQICFTGDSWTSASNINPLNFIEDFSGASAFFHITQYTDGLL